LSDDPAGPVRGYAFLEDVAIADVAFRAYGESLASVFEQAARATVETMVDDPDMLARRVERPIELDEDDREMLLLEFLQALIYFKDAELLLLLPDELRIDEQGGRYRLTATLVGEPIDPTRHRLNADVKAVTMHRFALERSDPGWQATVVLDI
jgi:SHS2 domain-containing protein